MVEDTIEAYREGRMTQIEFLNRMEATLDEFRTGHLSDLPDQLAGTQDAAAYYGLLGECFPAADLNSLAGLAAAIEHGLNRHKIRDWIANPDIANQMKGTLDDLIYGFTSTRGQALEHTALDALIDQVVEVAKHRELAR